MTSLPNKSIVDSEIFDKSTTNKSNEKSVTEISLISEQNYNKKMT